MYCMKCGRETKDNHIFCPDCLEGMAACPVKPGTPVQLPSRPTPAPAKKSANRRKGPTEAEQIVKLRKTVKWLALGMVALIAALFIVISVLVHTLEAQKIQGTIGQNYSTMTQPDSR